MTMYPNQMACNGVPSNFFPPNFLLQMESPSPIDQESHPRLPTTNPADMRGGVAMLGKRSMSFSGGEDELSDDEGSQAGGEKKRRLNLEQVRTLEKNFELGNKLEPERKMQLAAALGLQPRQVAIWFQNRRARWKTKQLEKDYEALKGQFEAVRAENEALLAHNKQLQTELLGLKGREATTEPINLNKETEGSCSNRSENSSDINLDVSRPPTTDFFPSYRPPSVTQVLQSSARPELQCPKAEHGGGVGQEESLCNMFYSVEDQSAFWAWSEQHNFHG